MPGRRCPLKKKQLSLSLPGFVKDEATVLAGLEQARIQLMGRSQSFFDPMNSPLGPLLDCAQNFSLDRRCVELDLLFFHRLPVFLPRPLFLIFLLLLSLLPFARARGERLRVHCERLCGTTRRVPLPPLPCVLQRLQGGPRLDPGLPEASRSR